MSARVLPVAFVIMPFSSELEHVFRELIVPAFFGYEVIRADTRFDERGILEKIITGIDEASIIVADLTSTNGNVMYELGVAHALGKPTIMLAQSVASLPFDIRSYPVHEYSTDSRRGIRLAAQLRELADRHREGLVQFANPVSDFIGRLRPPRTSNVAAAETYTPEQAVADAESAAAATSAFFKRFNEIADSYIAALAADTALIRGRNSRTPAAEDPGMQAAANDTRTYASNLNQLAADFHGIWELTGHAMLWLLASERREQLGQAGAMRIAEDAHTTDQNLNDLLGQLAELRHLCSALPEASGNLNHALEFAHDAASNLLNEIMTAKAYLARIARVAVESA